MIGLVKSATLSDSVRTVGVIGLIQQFANAALVEVVCLVAYLNVKYALSKC
mgnify:FL=1